MNCFRFCQTQITEDQLISVIVVISSTCNLSIKKSTTVHFSVKNLNKMKSNQSNLRHTTPLVGFSKIVRVINNYGKICLTAFRTTEPFQRATCKYANVYAKSRIHASRGIWLLFAYSFFLLCFLSIAVYFIS